MRTEATYPTSLRWLKSRSNSWGSKRKGCWLRGAATRRRAAEGRCVFGEKLGEGLFGGEVCLLKEHRHWPLQNQARGSRLGSL